MPRLTQQNIRNIGYLIISACLAAVAVIALYPGWLYPDPLVQWSWARLIYERGWPKDLAEAWITSHWPIYGINRHWPLFNTQIKVLFYYLTQGVGLFIWAQATLLFFSVYVFAATLLPRGGLALALIYGAICLWPNTVNLAVSHISDTLVAVCYMLLIAYHLKAKNLPLKDKNRWYMLADVMCLLFVFQLLRYNDVVTAMVITPFLAWRLLKNLRYRLIGTALVTALAIGIPAQYSNTMFATARYSSPASEGLAWRLWIQHFRYSSKAGDTALAKVGVKEYPPELEEKCITEGLWCSQLFKYVSHGSILYDPTMHRYLLQAYAESFFESPVDWVISNWPLYAAMTGLSSPVKNNILGQYQLMHITQRENPDLKMEHTMLRDWYEQAETGWQWAGYSRPLYLLMLNAALALFLLKKGRITPQQWHMARDIMLLTVAYIVPIILASADPQQRYYYPMTIPNTVLLLALIAVGYKKPKIALSGK